jgi:hypothetical protein
MSSKNRSLSPISDTSSVLTDEIDGEEFDGNELVDALVSSLTTPESGKNIAECIEEMTNEIRKLTRLIEDFIKRSTGQ